MNEKQKELLFKLGEVFGEIAEECGKDEKFHQLLIDNNDLYTMSLDELSGEWMAVAEGDRISTNQENQILQKLLTAGEHEVVKVGKHQIYKEAPFYVLEKFEFVEDGVDMFRVFDTYESKEEVVRAAIKLL
ncbi:MULTISPECIES: hypothetical protein [unclassified Psychrobacillus]|uniref:hypothetical protein n=1 Tax=unclassified Psychrobacillus TaxID=2636677 RepID=UPI0030FCF399